MKNRSFLCSAFLFANIFAFSSEIDVAIDSYLDSLSPEEQIAQIFLVNLDGNADFKAVETLNEKPLIPGGYLFFSYNIAHSAEQIINFTDSIYNYCKKNKIVQPYLAIDHEGGDVNRLRNIVSTLPSQKSVSENFSPKQIYSLYSLQAEQLKILGFTLNISPVAETLNSLNVDFLSDRSFGSLSKTAVFSLIEIRAYQDKGVGAVAKHFPGNTNTDPHSGLPEIKLSPFEVEQILLLPFAYSLFAKPSAVLMSHAKIPAISQNESAGLSKKWIKEILREELGFSGLVLSDDIFMQALSQNGYPPETAAQTAILAGSDVIMLSEKKFAHIVKNLLEEQKNSKTLQESLRKAAHNVIQFKVNLGIFIYDSEKNTIAENPNFSPENRLGSLADRLSAFSESFLKGEQLVFLMEEVK
mgnify:CR=1 FL=1